ncbi:hypothetical protein L596_025351 [Steinernema carpocapsae]|uniref:Uncharacterized protein n=1 Tax=Steinernema carpocapsae TaxID=34508 RepID=A0A4U5M7K6_STECR|nr:hypothetical protein L596_025351 [Steinernema carpocapsae]
MLRFSFYTAEFRTLWDKPSTFVITWMGRHGLRCSKTCLFHSDHIYGSTYCLEEFPFKCVLSEKSAISSKIHHF